MPAIVGTSTVMSPAKQTTEAAHTQFRAAQRAAHTTFSAESSETGAGRLRVGCAGRRVRGRVARRRRRTSDDVDLALRLATRCEVLVRVDAGRDLLFPRPLLELLVLLALHDREGRQRCRGLAHRAQAAAAHHQRVGRREQAGSEKGEARYHVCELRVGGRKPRDISLKEED
mgnify:CR=1 FL=1